MRTRPPLVIRQLLVWWSLALLGSTLFAGCVVSPSLNTEPAPPVATNTPLPLPTPTNTLAPTAIASETTAAPSPTATPTSTPTSTPTPTPTWIPAWTPSPLAAPDTSDWTTYENVTYTVRFSYPGEWTLTPYEWSLDSEGFSEKLHISLLDAAEKGHMALSIHPNLWSSPALFLEEMAQAAEAPEDARYPHMVIVAYTEVQGHEAVVFHWNGLIAGPFQSVAVAGEEWLYVFHTWADDEEDWDSRLQALDGVLNTLEILEATGEAGLVPPVSATGTAPKATMFPTFHLPDGAEEVGWLTHKRGKVESLAFSPDGRILATGHNNGDVVLWEMATGEQVHLLPHPQHQGSGHDLAFNADGSLLAVAEAFAGQVTLWDVSSGEKLRTLDAEGAIGQPLTDVAFSPDGSLLAAAKSSGQSLEPAGRTFVWRTADWQQLHVLEDAAPPVAFSPDGRQLFTLSGVAFVAWMPDRELAPIIQWDLERGERISEIPVDGFVISLALSPDGKMLAANVAQMGAGGSSFTLLLDTASNATLHRLPVPEGSQGPDTLTFNPNGAQLAVGYQNRVVIWDTATGRSMRDLKGPADWLGRPTFSPDDMLLAADSSNERILFWKMPENN